jgi:AraC-like DNA-binding protein
MSAKFLSDFISNLLNIPAAIVGDDPEFFQDFEKSHCFSPRLQQELTAEAMELFCSSIRKPCLYELRSVLEICAVLFPYNGSNILIGPYVEKGWDEKNAKIILAQHNIPVTQLVQYQYYYSCYRIVMPTVALRTCVAAIQALDPDLEHYDHKIISPIKADDPSMEAREMLNFDEVVLRYAIENEFLIHVKSGRAKEALETYERLSEHKHSNAYIHRDFSYAIASISILRTLLRKASEEAGVHPSVIDTLSGIFAQKAFALRNPSQMQNLSSEMVYGYTKAVQEVLRENYSKPIRKAVDYIKLHLGEQLALSDIAKAAGLAPNYLSHAFKAETGDTVTQYIAKKRCQIAEDLLWTTDLSISEVSNHVGYYDSNYFVKVFKAQYGLTPSKYRQSQRKTI